MAPVKRFFFTTAEKTEYTFKLSDEAVQNFIATQNIIRDEQTGSINFEVKTGFQEFPQELTEVRLSMFLKLNEDKGYITLFEDARLAVKREG